MSFFFYFLFFLLGWKRILFAEAPRYAINAITLNSIIKTNITKDWLNLNAYGQSMVERLAMALIAFTLLSFLISATKLAIAFLLYIPLLFHIRGNLKEYCCHKIDKRIQELLKKNSRKRRKRIARAAAKDNSKKKNKVMNKTRQPTLPNLENNYTETPPLPNYNHNSRFSEQLEPTMMAYRPPNQIPPHLNVPPLPPGTIPPEFPYNSRFRPLQPELPHNFHARYQPFPFTNNGILPAQYAPQNEMINNYYLKGSERR